MVEKPVTELLATYLVDKGRCPKHRKSNERQYDRQRGSATARGYGPRWQRLRLRILQRDAYLCQECKRAGRLNPVGKSGHVDHIIPKREGGTDEDTNLQTLCASCHNSKKQREERRGG
jgi:5-methylcytosine-specific restriction protein A